MMITYTFQRSRVDMVPMKGKFMCLSILYDLKDLVKSRVVHRFRDTINTLKKSQNQAKT